MTDEAVVDTNVAVVANGMTSHADDACIRNCVDKLQALRQQGGLLLDDKWYILKEYQRYLGARGRVRPGDAFIKWALTQQANEKFVRRVSITPDEERGFGEFPDDPQLAGFDDDDRKFVAVALASETRPAVLNASDRDWWEHREALNAHGITVSFLCPNLMSPSP